MRGTIPGKEGSAKEGHIGRPQILKCQPVMTLMSSNSNNPEVAMNLQRATYHWAKF